MIYLNSRAPAVHPVKHNERLRLINVSHARVYDLGFDGLTGWIVALDGQPLEVPVEADRLKLEPEQREDMIFDVTASIGSEGALVMRSRDQEHYLARFPVEGAARGTRLTTPDAQRANPVPALGSLETARRVDLLMEGGGMGCMRGAMVDGEMKTMGDLVANDLFWAFSGVAEIAFVADNSGDWLFHCHMLEHSAAGMLTCLKVV